MYGYTNMYMYKTKTGEKRYHELEGEWEGVCGEVEGMRTEKCCNLSVYLGTFMVFPFLFQTHC